MGESEPDLQLDDEHLPPLDLLVERHNPLLTHLGIVVTGLGAFTLVAGAFTLHSAPHPSELDPSGLRTVGGALAISGGGAIAVGVPLWLIGATAFASDPADSAMFVVGPGVLGLAGEF